MATFSGVITPMVTPFNRDAEQSINYDAAGQLIEKLVIAGVDGIFPLGSNGEFHLCSHEERVAFSKFVVDRVDHRVPVYVGTGACSTREACELSREAEAAGADALSVINPYFMKISDTELRGYFEAVAASVDIPIILYNIPKSTGKNIPAEVVAQLAVIDNIKGVKDSSGDMENLKSYVDASAGCGVDVLVGSDGKISAAHALGAAGAIAGTSNLITDVVVKLWAALESGDDLAAEGYQADIEPLRDVLHMGTTPTTLKRAMELSGVPVGPARLPAAEPSTEADVTIRSMLDHYGIRHD